MEKNYKNWKERRYNELNVADSPDDWFYLEGVTGKEDWYNKKFLRYIGDIAKQRGFDPKIAMAIAISETHAGNDTVDGMGGEDMNPMRAHPGVWGKWVSQYMDPVIERLDKEFGRADDIEKFHAAGLPVQNDVRPKQAISDEVMMEERKAWIHAALNQLQYATDKYGTGTRGMQAYSGTGKTIYGGRLPANNRQFGKEIGKTNFWREMPQGKRVQAIRSALEGVPAISEETYE